MGVVAAYGKRAGLGKWGLIGSRNVLLLQKFMVFMRVQGEREMKEICGQARLKKAGIDQAESLFTAGLLRSFTMQISIDFPNKE